MSPFVPIFIAIIIEAGLFSTAGLFAAAGLILLGGAAVGGTLLIGEIAKLLKPGIRGPAVTTRQPIAPRQVIYGTARVGGIVTFMDTTGSKNENLQLVITLTGHEANAIPTMYFDGVAVNLNGSGNSTSLPWLDKAGSPVVHAEFNLGTRDQAAFPGLITADPGAWNTNRRQRGCASVYVHLTWNATAFANGIPNITFDVQGRKVYDPRGVSASDSFEQPNGAPHAQWTAERGSFATTSDLLSVATVGADSFAMMYWNAASFSANQYAQLTINTPPTAGRSIGPAVRCASGAETFYGIFLSSGVIEIFKMVAGTNTTLVSTAWTTNPGDVLMLSASSTTITAFVNGVQVLTVVDAAIAAGSPGIGGFDVGTTDPLAYNWVGGNLFSGGNYTWSANAALCMADYLNHPIFGLNAQTKYGLVAAMLSESGLTGFTAANCVDGLGTNDGWWTDSAVAGATLSIDLGAGNSGEFRRCRILAATAGYPGIYDVQYSDDNSTWSTATAGLFFNPNVIGWNQCEIAPSGAHRYWRLLLKNTPGAGSFLNQLELYQSDVDSALLAAAANTCDEQVFSEYSGAYESRFTINGSFTTDNTPGDVITRMNSAMAGSVAYISGKWGIYPGIWRQPVISLGDADLRAPLKIQTRITHRSLFNGVRGSFILPANKWQPTDFPPYSEVKWLQEDNLEQLWLDVQYPFTTSPSTAQRLSKIALERERRQIALVAQCKLTAYQAAPMDTIQFSHPHFAWVNKTFEVISTQLAYQMDAGGKALAVGVDLVLRETDSTVFDWNPAVDESALPVFPVTVMPQGQIVQPPTGLALQSVEVVRGVDGVRSSGILLTWTAPPDMFVQEGGHIVIQYTKVGNNFQTFATVDGTDVSAVISPVSDGTAYDVQIYATNSAGASSTVDRVNNFVPTATSVTVDLSGTQPLIQTNSLGSMPPSLSGPFTYTCTPTSIDEMWNGVVVFRDDGTTTPVADGSQNITGLAASTGYYLYPYYQEGTLPPAFVQIVEIDQPLGSQTSWAFTLPNPVQAGSVLMFACRATNVTGITDSNGNTWASAESTFWYALNCAGGSTTVTVTLSATGPAQGSVSEYSGLANAAPDVVANLAAGTSTTALSTSVTPTVNGDLILAWGGNNTTNTPTYTAGSGYTLRSTPTKNSFLEDLTQGTAGAITATLTINASDIWNIGIVAFKAATTSSGLKFVGSEVTTPAFAGVKLDGSTAYVSSANLDTAPVGGFSVQCWFRTTSSVAGQVLVEINSVQTGAPGASFTASLGLVAATQELYGATKSGAVISTTNSYNDGQWHHAVFTYDGTTGILYADGVQVATGALAAATAFNGYWRIGWGDYVGNKFAGTISRVGVVTGTVLTAVQVANLYTTMLSAGAAEFDALAEPPMNSYWKLTETSGTSAADSAGTDTGTYQGTVTLNQSQALAAPIGSPAIAWPSPSLLAGQAQNLKGRVPLANGSIAVATVAAGHTGGGSGGGSGGGLGGCFSPNTKILTKRGIVRADEVLEGDELLTAKGTWRRVQRVLEHEYCGPMFEMPVPDQEPELITPQQKIRESIWMRAYRRFDKWQRYEGKIFNFDMDTPPEDNPLDEETEHSYTLANGRVAHNARVGK